MKHPPEEMMICPMCGGNFTSIEYGPNREHGDDNHSTTVVCGICGASITAYTRYFNITGIAMRIAEPRVDKSELEKIRRMIHGIHFRLSKAGL